jgi:hypothetical protein
VYHKNGSAFASTLQFSSVNNKELTKIIEFAKQCYAERNKELDVRVFSNEELKDLIIVVHYLNMKTFKFNYVHSILLLNWDGWYLGLYVKWWRKMTKHYQRVIHEDQNRNQTMNSSLSIYEQTNLILKTK